MTLLKTPHLRSLYRDANFYPNRENPSIEFWVAVIYHFLEAPRWNHVREFAPVLDDAKDLRKMDIALRKFVTENSTYFYSGILEGKRPKYDKDDIIKVEEQLHEYSSGYLNSCEEGESLWGFTTLGTRIRVWFTRKGGNLTAYYPQTTAIYTDAPYIDANTPDTTALENIFKHIDKHPWPTKETRGVSPEIPTQPPSLNPFSGPTVPPALVVQSPYSAQSSSVYGSSTPYHHGFPAAPSYNTVPIIQPPTQDASAAVPASGDLMSHEYHPLIPDDAILVDVEVETKESGDLYHFYHNNQHYIKGESDWVDRTVMVNGDSLNCVLYTGKSSRLNFYTWNLSSLEPYKGKGKGKGKGKR
jgi:hypothetical protein